VAFTIYPDAATAALLGTPANTPVPLAAGAAMASFAPLAGHVGPDPAAFNLPTTFIRISMLLPASANPPKVELVAVHTSMTEGMPVTITATSINTAQGLSDGVNPTDAASAYFFPPHADNVYLLKVVINIAGTTLKMKITNDTGAARDFVWVAGDSDAESQKPWIHVTPAALAYTALVNQDPDLTAQSVQITNRGTGNLTVNSIQPALPAEYVVLSGLPVTDLKPNPAVLPSVAIGFDAPAVIGDTGPADFTFDSTDTGAVKGAGRNNGLNLSASTSKLEIAMALDDSGSMSWGAGGEDPPIGGAANSRWSELRTAAKIFLELLAGFGENKGTFGIVKFPGKEGLPIPDVTSYDLDPAATAKVIPNVSSMTPTKNLLDATDPFYQGTPMFYALERLLTAPAPYFATDNTSRDRNRRWILLMSDGAWNSSPDPRGKIPQLSAGKIKVYSAGYGTAGEVDFATLQALSTGPGTTPGGLSLQVDAGAGFSAGELANAFKTAIKVGLTSVSSALDPTDVLHAGKPEARHSVIITPYDTKAAFMINWNTPDDDRLVLQLLTPTCDLITPELARSGRIKGVTYASDVRHKLYMIDQSYLRNDEDPSQPRYGTWRMIVSSPQLSEGRGSERYSYDVLVESSLTLEVTTDRAAYYAGDSINVSAKLKVNGLPITGAAVKLEVTMPGQSMTNWLAGVSVSDQEYRRAAEILSEKDASAIYIKAYAANLKGIAFNNVTTKTSISMLDPDNRGVYSATFDQTATPDSYKLYVTAVGTTPDGVVFRREQSLEASVSVRPKPGFTLVDLHYLELTPRPGLVTATVRVTPRDQFGNVVLIDPETSQDLVLQTKQAEVVDRFATNFDGTYTTRITYREGTRPSLSLLVAGEPVILDQVIAPVDQLHYVDEVLDFKVGLEGARGANRHTNPSAALGDIRRKPSDDFVSLGGYGSLTVGVKGQAILAQGEADVTVFVRPDSDLRSYLVEALPAGKQDDWVALGKSEGATQSFSLKAAGLNAASAVRITDTSGRTRGADLKPVETPGVSLFGVGVAKAGPYVATEETVTPRPRGCTPLLLLPIAGGIAIGLLIGLLLK
jgi:hypothetical protein